MPDDTKKLREEIERLADAYDDLIDNRNPANALKAIALDGEIRDLVRANRMIILAALRAMEALPISELEEAGMDLSKYTAAINWRPGDNTQEWLNDLHRRISTVQALYSARIATLASQQTPTPSSSPPPPA